VLLLSIVLTGCGGGVPQTQYDQTAAQLADAQTALAKAQSDLAALQTEKTTADADLNTAQAQVADLTRQVSDLEKQVSDLKTRYEFAGLTTEEKVAQIVKNYHETHTYSVTDLFVCGDMAAEVWNLLKTQGINALMVIGDINTRITDITLCSHAWVLAEVSPGQYLALETTGGITVTRAENALYYHGWTFTSPSDIKDYQQIVVKYNTGVTFHNWLFNEETRILNLYNNSANQAEAGQWLAVYNELVSLTTQKETDLNTLHAQLDTLATVLD
jgi:multidrug efflux pump subunit AcrA (membrane-fusion protein)